MPSVAYLRSSIHYLIIRWSRLCRTPASAAILLKSITGTIGFNLFLMIGFLSTARRTCCALMLLATPATLDIGRGLAAGVGTI